MRLLSLKSIGRFNIHPPAQISSLQRNCFSLSKSFFVHICVYDFHSSFTFITIFHYYNFLLLYSLSLQLWGFSFWGKQWLHKHWNTLTARGAQSFHMKWSLGIFDSRISRKLNIIIVVKQNDADVFDIILLKR